MNLTNTPSPTKPGKQPQESMSDTSFMAKLRDADEGDLHIINTPETATEDDALTICCIGNTGSGKSTIMNAIQHGAAFEKGSFKHDFKG